MSGDQEEPMDVDSDDCKMQSYTKDVEKAKGDVVRVTLSVEWPPDVLRKKYAYELQKALQTWANKNDIVVELTDFSVLQDGTVSLSISPSSVKDKLLPGQVLIGKEGKTLKITSINLTTSNAPVTASQNEHALQGGQRTDGSAVGDEKYAGIFPLSHFWYVHHICKEEIQRIERENGVVVIPEVKVNFRVNQKGGNAEKAAADLTNLVESHCRELRSSSVPVKKVSSSEIQTTLQALKKSDLQPLLTVSSEEIIILGAAQSQHDISRLLQKTSISTGIHDEESASSFPHVTETTRRDMRWHGMSIKDPALTDGLTIDEVNWKLIMTSYRQNLEKIKAKFGVDFKESDIAADKTTVKAHYKRSGGNPSMESHALRALLRLYQKVVMSPMNVRWLVGDSSKTWSRVDGESEGASAWPFTNGQPGNTEAPTAGGAAGGKDKEDTCPICLDAFNNKTQLKCKHEFCEECLAKSKKISGDICPICKDVFGLITGDQPPGSMNWKILSTSLPGFTDCGSIQIDYDIPSGIQTEKHPKPGKYYSGTFRTAYLPDNKKGKEVLRLLKKAFDQKLIFTVGVSRTTGSGDQVTWNDIHHKTSLTGGPEGFGYPDPGYLTRVTEELRAKGIK